MSSREHDRHRRDDYRHRSRSRQAREHQEQDDRSRRVEGRRERRPPHDLRDQNPRLTRRFTDNTHQHPAAQPSKLDKALSASRTHHHADPADVQHPPDIGTTAAMEQARPNAGSHQRQHGYLADSLRENRNGHADTAGYVSNRDRQQSYRQHPYHGPRQYEHEGTRRTQYRSGESSSRHRELRPTGMIADRQNPGSRPYRQTYNAGRGGQWPPRGRGVGTSGGGGFGGGGKWKHDMFEELVKESSVPNDTNLTQAPATASPGTHVKQKAAEPLQLS